MKKIYTIIIAVCGILLFSACEDTNENEWNKDGCITFKDYPYIINNSGHKVSVDYTIYNENYHYLLLDKDTLQITDHEYGCLVSMNDGVDSVKFVFDDTIRLDHRVLFYTDSIGANIWTYSPAVHNILSAEFSSWTLESEGTKSFHRYYITEADYQAAINRKGLPLKQKGLKATK